jgi:hypothetical protein
MADNETVDVAALIADLNKQLVTVSNDVKNFAEDITAKM